MTTSLLNQDRLITTSQEIDTAWLDQILRREGLLTSGALAGFDIKTSAGSWSQNAQIALSYAEGSTGEMPASLFLKTCRISDGFGSSEVDYYTRDYVGMPGLPLVPCYSAAYSAEHGAYHLLLADLSATHNHYWERPFTLEFGQTVARAIAALHAPYWSLNQTHPVKLSQPGAAELDRYFGHIRQGLEPLLKSAAPDIDQAQLALLPLIFERHPARLLERCQQLTGFTLVQGDINPGNILVPDNADSYQPLYLIDRQPFGWSLTTWLGLSDLTYFLITWQEPDVRRKLEIPVLQSYYAELIARGVTDYTWEQLWADYRLCAIQNIYIAVEWCVLPEDVEKMRWLWLAELKRGLAAFADLDCLKLLEA